MKTLDGYKTPEESILFDPAWESILNRKEIPTIDENFYGTEILVYKHQLRHIGVKVDPPSVCSLLFELANQGQFCEETSIASFYTFLNKFHWRPEVPDETELKVYVHDYGWFELAGLLEQARVRPYAAILGKIYCFLTSLLFLSIYNHIMLFLPLQACSYSNG